MQGKVMKNGNDLAIRSVSFEYELNSSFINFLSKISLKFSQESSAIKSLPVHCIQVSTRHYLTCIVHGQNSAFPTCMTHQGILLALAMYFQKVLP